MARYESWGCYPKIKNQQVQPLLWTHEAPSLQSCAQNVLPHGYGRSYGDSCLNEGGILLDTTGINRFLSFDSATGLLRCESGVSLHEIIKTLAPHGWFLPVTPGTKYVSVGGAIANDVHGKNHHLAGTFGCHVRGFELLRSDGTRRYCSLDTHPDLFQATIGGLGLTGLILWADIQLKHIPNQWITAERVKFSHVEDFYELSFQSERDFEYTVAWIDCFASVEKLGRGIFIRGNHNNQPNAPHAQKFRKTIQVPCNVPSYFLNTKTLKIFNALYYHSAPKCKGPHHESFDQFFYPLDSILDWNRLYGNRGFLQYQCVIPPEHQKEGIKKVLRTIQESGQGSFLAVLKQFGNLPSPGLLSFPRPGTTLALDFAYQGPKTLNLLNTLDDMVMDYGGAVYPAKDARMSPSHFQQFFPHWDTFKKFVDPKFSSSFWRRVTNCSHSQACSDQNFITNPNTYSPAVPEFIATSR